MKIQMMLSIFIILVLSVLSIEKGKDQIENKKTEVVKSEIQKLETVKVVPSKKTTGKEGKFHNSIGLKVQKSIVLENSPFKITRCDQIVLFKAQYISDMGDYRLRKDGFFSITAYYVNQFKDRDAKKLDESILLTESKNQAQHLKGARGCVYIDGGNFRNDIAICLDNKSSAKNILTVLDSFARCRMGDNLQPISLDLIRKLMRNRGKNCKSGDSKKNSKNKKSGKKSKKNSKKFWHRLSRSIADRL